MKFTKLVELTLVQAVVVEQELLKLLTVLKEMELICFSLLVVTELNVVLTMLLVKLKNAE